MEKGQGGIKVNYRVVHLQEETIPYMAGKGCDRSIGLHLLQDFCGKSCSEKIMREEQTKQEHSDAGQLASLFHDLPPWDLWSHTDQFSNAADPLQSFPAVFGPMHAEDQEQILRGEGPYDGAGKRD